MAVEYKGDHTSAEQYRQKADEMKQQAQRAETVYLQAIYASIADNWERLAAQMSQAERAQKKDRAAENQPVPPPQAGTQASLPRA